MQQRDITPDTAREFFLYHSDCRVAANLEEIMGEEPGEIELVIDRGRNDRDEMTGGDILIGPRFQKKFLTDAQLVALAKHMGVQDWIKPNTGPETFIKDY